LHRDAGLSLQPAGSPCAARKVPAAAAAPQGCASRLTGLGQSRTADAAGSARQNAVTLKLSFFSSDRTIAYAAAVKSFVAAGNGDGEGVVEIEGRGRVRGEERA